MPEQEFKLRSAIWWISVAFTEQLKKDKPLLTDNVQRNALERKWILLFAARLILECVLEVAP